MLRIRAFTPKPLRLVRAVHQSSGHSNGIYRSTVPTDDTAIPLRPTWSVDELLSSYPRPSLSSERLARLHQLSALIPPAEGTAEHARLSEELGDLMKLVEAVRLIDIPTEEGEIPDGRVQPHDAHIQLVRNEREHDVERSLPQEELMARAARTRNGFYEIPTDRVARR